MIISNRMGGRRTLGQHSPHVASLSRVLGRQRHHRRALLKSERVFNVIPSNAGGRASRVCVNLTQAMEDARESGAGVEEPSRKSREVGWLDALSWELERLSLLSCQPSCLLADG
jgi:hypothetical protein